MPAISICIPAYQRVHYLERLLNSIKEQSFRDFEVVITDDSPDLQVHDLCAKFQKDFKLIHHKNPLPLGTPENWNECIRRASATWIKLMHDDDWFAHTNSLQQFADAANSKATFIYSAFNNVDGESIEKITPEKWRIAQLYKNPVSIISKNIIGPPSVTMYKKNDIFFDNKMKWLVDMDFYIRYLNHAEPVLIPSALINIGIHSTQVTVSSKLNRDVEIPEHLRLLDKVGEEAFRNILFFDAYWRLMRNLQIKAVSELQQYSPNKKVTGVLEAMINWQQRVGLSRLRSGPVSKLFMILCYLRHRPAILPRK